MDWLGKPVIGQADGQPVPLDDPTAAQAIQSTVISTAMKRAGFTHLLPVQATLLTAMSDAPSVRPRDYAVSAPTGSGKTLAYIIPILRRLLKRKVVRLRALVIVPSRLLVAQVHAAFMNIIGEMEVPLVVGMAMGKGSSLGVEQRRLFDAVEGKALVDILVATPGRLVEHLRFTPGFDFRDLEVLIVDEADRLLDQSYQDWLQLVHKATCPVDRLILPFGEGGTEGPAWRAGRHLQTFLFSATLCKRPVQLAHLHLHDPLLVQIVREDHAQQSTPGVSLPSTLTLQHIAVPEGKKPLALAFLLSSSSSSSIDASGGKMLCFCSSAHTVHRLAALVDRLHPSLHPAFITADTADQKREEILRDFDVGKCRMLIGTDAMGRGMDVGGVEAVINYDCPTGISAFVHRAGRTARAGRTGRCITVLSPREARFYKDTLVKSTGSPTHRIRPTKEELAALSDIVTNALNK